MEPLHISYQNISALTINEGIQVRILLRAEDTNNSFAMFEDLVDPGVGPGRHIHHLQDETFIVIEGSFDLETDGAIHHLKPGDVALVPKGTPHTWKNVGLEKARIRYFLSPALNIEDMFKELHELRKAGDINTEKLKALGKKYPKQQSVGPPL
ncbi:MAG: cupin domain-containing protein [Cytophagales bacterium]|nr:cupin domain-containing protein [Cytophagales bacterium]